MTSTTVLISLSTTRKKSVYGSGTGCGWGWFMFLVIGRHFWWRKSIDKGMFFKDAKLLKFSAQRSIKLMQMPLCEHNNFQWSLNTPCSGTFFFIFLPYHLLLWTDLQKCVLTVFPVLNPQYKSQYNTLNYIVYFLFTLNQISSLGSLASNVVSLDAFNCHLGSWWKDNKCFAFIHC